MFEYIMKDNKLSYTVFPWMAHSLSFAMNNTFFERLPSDRMNGATIKSWNGDSHHFQRNDDGRITIDGTVTILEENAYYAKDGVVHVVDSWLDTGWLHRSVIEELEENYPEWYHLFETANLKHVLEGKQAKTIFVPQSFSSTFENDTNLESILLYHVLPDMNYACVPVDFWEHMPSYTNRTLVLPTALSGYDVDTLVVGQDYSVTNRDASINGIPIIKSDILANNGIIQILEEPMPLPPNSEIND